LPVFGVGACLFFTRTLQNLVHNPTHYQRAIKRQEFLDDAIPYTPIIPDFAGAGGYFVRDIYHY
jgi:hypothetical protein